MALNCIVVEDTEIEAELLVSFIRKIDFLNLEAVFQNSLEAQKYILTNSTDLIISDIMLPDITGLQMIKTLENPSQVIFITSFPDYAVEGFNLEATDYIVKPLTFERFLKAANRALQKHMQKEALAKKHSIPQEEDHFFIRSDFSFVKVSYRDILFIESIKDYVRVVTTKGSYLTSMTMIALEEQIPMRDFIRIHRSYIVNGTQIEAIKNDEIVIAGKTLPVSKPFRDNLYQTVVGSKIVKR